MRARNLLASISSFIAAVGLATAVHAGPPGPNGVVVGGDFNDDGNGDNAYQGQMGSAAAGQVRVQVHTGLTVDDTGFVADGGGTWLLRDGCNVTDDNKTDLVFEGASGSVAEGAMRIVPMDGVMGLAPFFISTGGGIWAYFGCADVNGDGTEDLIYVGLPATGAFGFVRVDLIVSGAVDSKIFFPTGGGAYDLGGAGDADGDGDADFYFQGADGGAADGFGRVTLSDGSTAGFLGTSGGDFAFGGFGDANQDGTQDLFFIGTPATGTEGLGRFNLLTPTTGVPGAQSFVTTGASFSFFNLGDADGDGDDADVVLSGPTNNRILLIENAAVDSQTFPSNSGGTTELRRLVDLNGDSTADLGSDTGGSARFQILTNGAVSDTGDVPTAGGAWQLLSD